jgi:hypothetical protein
VFGFQKSFADIKTLILMDISSVGQTEWMSELHNIQPITICTIII